MEKIAENPAPDVIRAARQSAGLTQTQAAALIYCTLRGWQDWEGGKRAMHPAFFELFLLKVAERNQQKHAMRVLSDAWQHTAAADASGATQAGDPNAEPRKPAQ